MSDYVMDWDTAKFVCPDCGAEDSFFINGSVPAWMNVNIEFVAEGEPPAVHRDGYVEVESTSKYDFEADDRFIACVCGFESSPEDLELQVDPAIGWDGQPRKTVHPNQEALPV